MISKPEKSSQKSTSILSSAGSLISKVASDIISGDLSNEEYDTTVFGDVIMDIEDIPDEIIDPI